MTKDRAKRRDDAASDEASKEEAQRSGTKAPNPPRTTTGPLTAPKFGSAGSGGAELEPGPERD
jgi:hypothetical protein